MRSAARDELRADCHTWCGSATHTTYSGFRTKLLGADALRDCHAEELAEEAVALLGLVVLHLVARALDGGKRYVREHGVEAVAERVQRRRPIRAPPDHAPG